MYQQIRSALVKFPGKKKQPPGNFIVDSKENFHFPRKFLRTEVLLVFAWACDRDPNPWRMEAVQDGSERDKTTPSSSSSSSSPIPVVTSFWKGLFQIHTSSYLFVWFESWWSSVVACCSRRDSCLGLVLDSVEGVRLWIKLVMWWDCHLNIPENERHDSVMWSDWESFSWLR